MQVREKDYVTIRSGRMKDRGGTVAYIWRGTLFLHCKDIPANGGYIAVKSFSTMLRGGATGQGQMSNSARANAILAGGTPGRTPPVSISPGGSYNGPYARYTPASPRPDDPSTSGGSGAYGPGGVTGPGGKFQMALPQRPMGPQGGRGPGSGQFSGRSFHAQAHSQYVGKVVSVVLGWRV